MGRMLAATAMMVGLAVGVAAAAAAALPAFDTTRLYSEQEFAAAMRPYTEAIARNANDADAHYWLGVAYLHAFKLFKFGFAPYARGHGGRAVASLERAVQLNAGVSAMLVLSEAYIAIGERSKHAALVNRMFELAPPLQSK